MLGPPLPLLVFVHFSMTSPSPLLNERTFWMTQNFEKKEHQQFCSWNHHAKIVILCSISNLSDDFQTSIWIKKTRTNFNFKMYRSLNFDKSYFYKQHEIFKVWANRIF